MVSNYILICIAVIVTALLLVVIPYCCVRTEGKKLKVVVAGVIVHNGKVLIGKRPPGGPQAGYWEFPGGKQETGETIKQCLRRELEEELGVQVTVGKHIRNICHAYENGKFKVCFYRVDIADVALIRMWVHQKLRWVVPAELCKYRLMPADTKLVKHLKNLR